MVLYRERGCGRVHIDAHFDGLRRNVEQQGIATELQRLSKFACKVAQPQIQFDAFLMNRFAARELQNIVDDLTDALAVAGDDLR